MHKNFADWYQPVTFKHDREIINPRWNGIEKVFEILEPTLIFELVKLVFEKQTDDSQTIQRFKQQFKEADPTFPSTGNDEEVMVLAGSVLALICLEDAFEVEEDLIYSTALSILTSTACNSKRPLVNIDLIGMASNTIYVNGIADRKRPDKISPVEYSEEDGDTEASVTKKIVDKINSLQKILTIQDEEIQILWWINGGYSSLWKNVFDKLEISARPLLLSKEIAIMTKIMTEPPSLVSIFTKILNADIQKVTIPIAVKSCTIENLNKLKKGKQLSPTIFPLHLAINRAFETGGDGSWASVWNKLTGIAQNKKFNPVELSFQLFREHKLIELSEAWDE
jgi:hypothetical protein